MTMQDHQFADSAFANWPRTPAQHFKLCVFAAVSRLIRQVVETLGTHEETFAQFPFLAGYDGELAECEPNDLTDDEAEQWWHQALRKWESSVSDHLPLRALRDECGIDDSALTVLMCAGLIEEDVRFGSLFEAVQDTPGQQRPTVGLLQAWWRDEEGYMAVRANLRRLRELGLIQFVNTDAPGPQCAIPVHIYCGKRFAENRAK